MDAVTLSTAAVAVATAVFSGPAISVNYPAEKAAFGTLSAAYILGNVQPPDSKLTLNGRPVSPHPKGGFLAYVPVAPGDFTFHLEASSGGATAVLDRHVRYDLPFISPDTDKVQIDSRSVQPAADLELRPGDWVKVQARGKGGLKAAFKIKNLRRSLPMVETQAGLYEGAYQIRPGDHGSSQTIRIELAGKHHRAFQDAPGRLSVPDDSPRAAVFERDTPFEFTPVRSAPGQGYSLFAPNGVRTLVTGRAGDELRIELAPGITGWVPANALKLLPEGTPPPEAVLGTIEGSRTERGSIFKISLSEHVPYKVEERPGRLKLTLYRAQAHTNWVIFDPQDPRIKDLRWSEPSDGVAEIEVWTRNGLPLWGYNVAQTPGGLELELRWPPPPVEDSSAPLKGLTIVLDPGHSPSDPGRIGPTGHTERELNLLTARVLEGLLKTQGAGVVLTRTNNDQEVGLQERVDLAWKSKADLLLSLHNNALADGMDPYKQPHGFSVFYYHPQSRDAAESIYRAYQRDIPLADEGLRFGDLFLTRTTRMPAVLVESAYFIFPDQEQMLADDAFQAKLGRALLSGITDYFSTLRRPAPAH